MSKLTFVLDGEVVSRDDLGDPNNYFYLVDGRWKGNDELTDEDINTLYYSGHRTCRSSHPNVAA